MRKVQENQKRFRENFLRESRNILKESKRIRQNQKSFRNKSKFPRKLWKTKKKQKIHRIWKVSLVGASRHCDTAVALSTCSGFVLIRFRTFAYIWGSYRFALGIFTGFSCLLRLCSGFFWPVSISVPVSSLNCLHHCHNN